MPNGYYGSKEEWDRMEAPLKELDPILNDYGRKHNLRIEKNYHDWPSRSLQWTKDGMSRSIQIYFGKEQGLLFNLRLVAWQDPEEGKRCWKNVFLKKEVPITEIKTKFRDLLDLGRTTLNSWQSSDLEFISYGPGSKEFEEDQREKRKQSFKRFFGL